VTEGPGDPAPGQLSMPAPGKEPGNTYARAMSAVLSYLGTEASYNEVMGLSGVAFILQIDTSGPYLDGELDCAWWPNDSWGFYLGASCPLWCDRMGIPCGAMRLRGPQGRSCRGVSTTVRHAR
jgi:hypothetical protein